VGGRGRKSQEEKPFAILPLGLAGVLFSITEIKSWRHQEQNAGRPSGIEDFYRAHSLCSACKTRGIAVSPVGWDGDIPLFEQCNVCSGTGKLINPSM